MILGIATAIIVLSIATSRVPRHSGSIMTANFHPRGYCLSTMAASGMASAVDSGAATSFCSFLPPKCVSAEDSAMLPLTVILNKKWRSTAIDRHRNEDGYVNCRHAVSSNRLTQISIWEEQDEPACELT